jgi:hypothetical protein
MTRYFFNLYDRVGFVADDEGSEMPTLERAHGRALKEARAIISDDVLRGTVDLNGRIEIMDSDRHVVLVVPFRDVVQFAPDL